VTLAPAGHEVLTFRLVPEDQDIRRRAERRIGSVLLGKYRLDAILGVGGMAVVYAATHRNQKKVAVKVLHPELSLRGEVRSRFLREGYAANVVEHEGVVAVLDDDVDPTGGAFLVMELLGGLDVHAWCARSGGRLPLRAALRVTEQALEILGAAHAKGVIHRDLKPANLFMQFSGQLKVLDFGIAHVRERALDNDVTRTGALLGTPAFMAPEQASAQRDQVDARTDLWAVGATLFSLLSGEHVHQGEHANQVLIRAATAEARSVLAVCPELPPPVADLLSRSLAFEKGSRFQSAAEMAAAVGRVRTQLCGELQPQLEPSFVAAAATTEESTPSAEIGRSPSVAGSGPTVSAAVSGRVAALDAPAQDRRSSVEPVIVPGPRRGRPRRAASLFGVAAGLLCVGLIFDWYISRSVSQPPPVTKQAAVALAAPPRGDSPAIALPASFVAVPQLTGPAPAVLVAATGMAAHPFPAPAIHRAPAAVVSSADPTPAFPTPRVAKNPLDVELQ
jgi:serine/threonine protein kinase